jgi:hypothetical protein
MRINNIEYVAHLPFITRRGELITKGSTHFGSDNVDHGRRLDGKIIRS